MFEVTGELDACVVCLRTHKQPSIFCSLSCERYFQRERRRVAAEQAHWRTCGWCLSEFRACRKDSVFCSSKCRTSAHRARHEHDSPGHDVTASAVDL
jgi:predicted nucleic acid-binding Zn ribbon protein